MKKTLYEIIGIVVLSGVFALVYNYFTPKPFPLIYKEKEVSFVSEDSLLNLKKTWLHDTLAKEIARSPEKHDTSNAKSTQKDNSEVSTSSKPKEPKSIKYGQVVKYLHDTDFIFVDARSEEAYSKGHIGKAINIYPYDENPDNYFRALMQLPKNKIIVVYCDGGKCDLSHHVINDLFSFGFNKVFLYAGGWEEWEKRTGKSG